MNKFFAILVLAATSLFASEIREVKMLHTGSRVYNGYYVGQAFLDPFPNYVWCFDNTREVNVGDVWQAKILSFDELESSYFVNNFPSDYVERYKKVAFLGSLFSVMNPSEWGFIQYAIWNVFNDSGTMNNSSINYYLNLPNTMTDYSSFRVIVDVMGIKQGLMTRVPSITPTAVDMPEPYSMALVGMGLIGFTFFRKKN